MVSISVDIVTSFDWLVDCYQGDNILVKNGSFTKIPLSDHMVMNRTKNKRHLSLQGFLIRLSRKTAYQFMGLLLNSCGYIIEIQRF
jgi:hypothetical protein